MGSGGTRLVVATRVGVRVLDAVRLVSGVSEHARHVCVSVVMDCGVSRGVFWSGLGAEVQSARVAGRVSSVGRWAGSILLIGDRRWQQGAMAGWYVPQEVTVLLSEAVSRGLETGGR